MAAGIASFVELAGSQGRERPRFTSHTDHVFCRPDGAPLDRSGVRSRFIRVQEQAGVRVRRFHDLRHTFGSLAIQQFDLDTVRPR